MKDSKHAVSKNLLEAELLAALKRDSGFCEIQQVVVHRVEHGKTANWGLAKISPPIVLGPRRRWVSIKRVVEDLQDRYDMADE